MPAKSILIGGTGSHVGKSWMAAAICRWLHRKGLRVAPFKAQNMSNNSFPCPEGGEIGRAQVVQAEACGLAPSPDMNPILLKPTADSRSQVVVHGKVWKDLAAGEYYENHDWLLDRVLESHERLSRHFDYIVMEGAGSIVELNLRRTDLVNLGLARRLKAPALLVGDIDRGGIFAAIYGTIDLLDGDEARLVKAFAVNRFRGDPKLFASGVGILEEKTGLPCLGVFPWLEGVQIDEEDGVSLDFFVPARDDQPRIAILRFPRISNLTDFRLLRWAEWVHRPDPGQFDIVILPGTKNTIADLEWMRARGLDEWVKRQHGGGAHIVGVCGGYQMLGQRIEDPDAVESAAGAVDALGLLPVGTVLEIEKTTVAVCATTPGGASFGAYEIHMGRTERPSDAPPFAHVEGHPEGVRRPGCTGTYLHGALENPAVLRELFGIEADDPMTKEASYDRLADWFEASANTTLFEQLFL